MCIRADRFELISLASAVYNGRYMTIKRETDSDHSLMSWVLHSLPTRGKQQFNVTVAGCLKLAADRRKLTVDFF